MKGEDFKNKVYDISAQLDSLVLSSQDSWQDKQANNFNIYYVESIRKSLREMSVPGSVLIDTLNSRLEEIKGYANG